MDLSKGLWDRSGRDEIGTRMYAFILGVSLVWSVFLVALGASFTYDYGANFWISLGSFVGAIFGITMYTRSKTPVPSFIGVSILSIFLGSSIGPVLYYYNLSTILTSLTVTFLITIVMVFAGVLMPNVIKKAGGLLFVALLVLLFGYFAEFLLSIFRFRFSFAFLDWIAVFVFSAYIWYDYAKAMSLPKTLKNAIDASGSLIIDIVNLFMVLLRIIGRSR